MFWLLLLASLTNGELTNKYSVGKSQIFVFDNLIPGPVSFAFKSYFSQ